MWLALSCSREAVCGVMLGTLLSVYLLSLMVDLVAIMSPLGSESGCTSLSFLWVRSATSMGFMKPMLSRS